VSIDLLITKPIYKLWNIEEDYGCEKAMPLMMSLSFIEVHMHSVHDIVEFSGKGPSPVLYSSPRSKSEHD
jgi:hypothetical protein